MVKDEIVAEVRKIRGEYAAKFNYDIDAIFSDIKKKEKKESRKFISPPKKRFANSEQP